MLNQNNNNNKQNEERYINVDVLLETIKAIHNNFDNDFKICSGFGDDLYWIGYEDCLTAIEDSIDYLIDTKGLII